ncbi:3-deoxy-manno-octulosonate cytidylyltransferase [bacterium]|nr:3-deoxy-manno-octulosonate cytidylyltransferase [bacterium]
MEFIDTIIMIPARLGSSRLPNKPLVKINGMPLIIHAYNCAKNAKLNVPIIVATDNKLILKIVNDWGGTALMTSHQHESGSDRILEALEKFDPEKKYKNIIHLQGDLPNISGNLIQKLAQVANDPLKEITTVIVKASPDEFDDPSVVKVAVAFKKDNPKTDDVGRALYFSRACIPSGSQNIWHHIGIYAWQRSTLEEFVKLKPSPLEKSEKLEQLRALESGMQIHTLITSEHPIGVDTKSDLKKAENYFKDLV